MREETPTGSVRTASRRRSRWPTLFLWGVFVAGSLTSFSIIALSGAFAICFDVVPLSWSPAVPPCLPAPPASPAFPVRFFLSLLRMVAASLLFTSAICACQFNINSPSFAKAVSLRCVVELPPRFSGRASDLMDELGYGLNVL
jgi:hypothetical protein